MLGPAHAGNAAWVSVISLEAVSMSLVSVKCD